MNEDFYDDEEEFEDDGLTADEIWEGLNTFIYPIDEYSDLADDVCRFYKKLRNSDPHYTIPSMEKYLENSNVLGAVLRHYTDPGNQKDIELCARILATKQPDDSEEEKREEALKKVLYLAKEGKIADIHALALLPTTQFEEIAKQVMNFYHTYSPYDWRCSMDGWFDRAGKPTQLFETQIESGDKNVNDLMEDLHFFVNLGNENRNEQMKKDAQEILDGLAAFVTDPVPDEIEYIVCEPQKNARFEKTKNEPDCFKKYKGKPMCERSLGSGLYISFQRDARENGEPKNRVAYTLDDKGELLGTVRGTFLIYAREPYHKLTENMTDLQQRYAMAQYAEPELYDGRNLEELGWWKEMRERRMQDENVKKLGYMCMANDSEGIARMHYRGVSNADIYQAKVLNDKVVAAVDPPKPETFKPVAPVKEEDDEYVSDEIGMK